MHGGPAIQPIADVCRDALLARDGEEARNEAVIAVSMDRWRKANDGRAHAPRRLRKPGRFRFTGEMGIGHVFLGCKRAFASKEQRAGSDDERAAGTSERRAERLDGALVRLRGRRVVREVVDEGGVNHSIRAGRAIPQAVQVFERAAKHLGSRRGKGRGTLIRTSEAEHSMARVHEFRNNGGADKARRAGDKDTHNVLTNLSRI